LLASIRLRYSTLVRRVPDERARRRPGDAVRVVVAAIILTLLALHANDPSAAERALARFFRLLPDDAESFVLVVYDLLALWALALVDRLILQHYRDSTDVGIYNLAYQVATILLVLMIAANQGTVVEYGRAIHDEAIRHFLTSKQPLAGGPGTAADCAEAAVFLCSDESRLVTGAVLAVDGGWCVSEGQYLKDEG